jgi:hypothetical protein
MLVAQLVLVRLPEVGQLQILAVKGKFEVGSGVLRVAVALPVLGRASGAAAAVAMAVSVFPAFDLKLQVVIVLLKLRDLVLRCVQVPSVLRLNLLTLFCQHA